LERKGKRWRPEPEKKERAEERNLGKKGSLPKHLMSRRGFVIAEQVRRWGQNLGGQCSMRMNRAVKRRKKPNVTGSSRRPERSGVAADLREKEQRVGL